MCLARSLSLFWCGFLLACVLACQPVLSQTATPAKIYLIGNSLTWDTLPGVLEGDVQWHVDCGKNLKFIFENTQQPCVKTSTLWPQALRNKAYDWLCVQPHMGTNLEEDLAAISAWLDLQPQAKLIVHTGWNRSAEFEATYHKTLEAAVAELASPQAPLTMSHAPYYFAALTAKLQARYPQLEIRSTHAIEVLDEIYQDIQAQRAPFKSFEELYRDNIHMTVQVGRYLMHNLMRIALDQPISEQGFQLEPQHKAYLLGKLLAIQSRQRS